MFFYQLLVEKNVDNVKKIQCFAIIFEMYAKNLKFITVLILTYDV